MKIDSLPISDSCITSKDKRHNHKCVMEDISFLLWAGGKSALHMLLQLCNLEISYIYRLHLSELGI